MCISDGIEDVGDAELADRNHQPVGGARSGKLIDAGVDLIDFPTEVDRLPYNHSRQPRVRDRGSDLIGFAAGKSGHPEGGAQTETLIDFGVDPELGTVPEPNASIKRDIPGLAPGVRVEDIRTMIWRAKWEGVLAKECGLPMKGEPVQIQCSRSVGENVRIDCIAADAIIEAQSQALNGKR